MLFRSQIFSNIIIAFRYVRMNTLSHSVCILLKITPASCDAGLKKEQNPWAEILRFEFGKTPPYGRVFQLCYLYKRVHNVRVIHHFKFF